MKLHNKLLSILSVACLGLTLGTAGASHFRGGAIVPSIDAQGVLTATVTTFWRPAAVTPPSASAIVMPGSGETLLSTTTDTSDSRYTVVNQVWRSTVTAAGNYQISFGSCCRVAGILNLPNEPNNGLRSTIAWDGSTASTPIAFNFSSIQPEVSRLTGYSDSIGAVSPDGDTLSYARTTPLSSSLTNLSNFTQPPGFAIDPVTGVMTIPQVNAATYGDNTSNAGADYAFAGVITATDASGATTGTVGFDWLFDAVNATQNRAPTVDDAVINALVGDTVGHIFTGSDPDGNPLTWSFVGQLGSAPAIAPTFNPLTQSYSWDTTGSAPGTYIAQARASDGSLTDIGNLTVNLSTGTPTGVPDGGSTAAMLGLALLGLLCSKKSIHNK